VTAPRDRENAPPPPRPRRWHWLVSFGLVFGSIAGKIAVELLVTELAGLAALAVIVAVAGLLVLAVQELRSRKAREAIDAAAPPPTIRTLRPARTIVELPPAPHPVIRRSEVAWLSEAISVDGAAVLLVGRAGVGTSTCVVQAANLARRRRGVPGPWYIDLNPGGRPLPARKAKAAIDDKLGSDCLIVLDNAVSARQVQPILRQPRRCRLLIAGGPALSDLKRVVRRWLPEPSQEEAASLFASTTTAGSLSAPTDPAVTGLVDLCGRQPYAVRALALWITARGWRPSAVLAALEAELAPDGWHQGRHQDRQSVTLALLLEWDLAYWELSAAARRLLRLLALVPYPLPREAVAALAGVSVPRADRLLSELATAGCVASDPDERYTIRPLLARYCRTHLWFEESVRNRAAALTRVLRQLAERAEQQAARLLASAQPDPGWLGTDPAAWFARHQPLLDALTGRQDAGPRVLPPVPSPSMVRWRFRLAAALSGWYAASGQLDDWSATCTAILTAEPPVPRRMASWAYNELGVALRRMGDAAAAERELYQAAALRSRRGVAQTRTNLGLALLDRNELENAVEQLQVALRHRSRADRAGQARSRLGLGVAFLVTGRAAEARRQLVLAANVFQATGDRHGYGAALSNLMLAQWAMGEYLDAAQARTAALESLRGAGDRSALAAALLNAAATLINSEVSDPVAAHRMLTESLALRSGLPDRPGTGRCHLYLGDTTLALGDPDRAAEHWRAAASICGALGDAAGARAALGRLDQRSPGAAITAAG
jgi:tetratricopeptide (TPR) repeat protein